MNPAREQVLAERVLAILADHHKGAANGISANDLACACGTNPRDLRSAVQAAREAGTYIAATPSTGYYMPDTPGEIEHASDYLLRRALASLKQVAAMNRQSIPDAIKQLEIAI